VRRCLVLSLLLLTLLPVASAHAARSQGVLFDARRDLLEPSTRERTFDLLQGWGVTDLRLLVYWHDVAPSPDGKTRPSVDLTDPANYTWGAYDEVIGEAVRRGFRVVPTLTLPGPVWAMRDKDDQLSYPDAALFGRFVEAMGRRYGTEIDTWAIGNEPNHPAFLRPQWKGGVARSPGIYRSLYLAASRGLDASGNADDSKLLGEMLPRGNRGTSVTPLAFLRGVLCLDRDGDVLEKKGCGRLDIDGVATHPYSTQAGPYFVSPNKDDVTIGTLSRLTRLLDKAAKQGVVRKAMPIWLTEFGVQSSPDRISGVSVQRQVELRALSEWISWRNPRVTMFSQYLLTDDSPREDVPASERYGGFETGLRYSTGRDKPSLTAFPLTLSAQRVGSKVVLWGVVRPATGETGVELLFKDPGKEWKVLKRVGTDATGVLQTTTARKAGRRYNLRWEGREGWPVRVVDRP
jgi:hypothetical protein